MNGAGSFRGLGLVGWDAGWGGFLGGWGGWWGGDAMSGAGGVLWPDCWAAPCPSSFTVQGFLLDTLVLLAPILFPRSVPQIAWNFFWKLWFSPLLSDELRFFLYFRGFLLFSPVSRG